MYMYDKWSEGWVPSNTKNHCSLSHTSDLLSLTISRTKCWREGQRDHLPMLSAEHFMYNPGRFIGREIS